MFVVANHIGLEIINDPPCLGMYWELIWRESQRETQLSVVQETLAAHGVG